MTDKIIYFTRHAQAEHNVAEDYSIRDAPLTPLGRRQSAALNEDTKTTFQLTADLLVSSPLRRPMQTMLVGYPGLKARLNNWVILLPQLQEVNSTPCDRGSPRENLEADPEFAGLDFSGLQPDWISKSGVYDPDNVADRAKWVRKWLRARPEKKIVVVAHGDILRSITDGYRSDTPWANAEVKTYTFRSEDDEDAVVITVDDNEAVREGENAKTSSGK